MIRCLNNWLILVITRSFLKSVTTRATVAMRYTSWKHIICVGLEVVHYRSPWWILTFYGFRIPSLMVSNVENVSSYYAIMLYDFRYGDKQGQTRTYWSIDLHQTFHRQGSTNWSIPSSNRMALWMVTSLVYLRILRIWCHIPSFHILHLQPMAMDFFHYWSSLTSPAPTVASRLSRWNMAWVSFR